MPARNIYHDAVVDALVADGWTVTDDPLRLTYGEHDMYVDLGLVGSTLVAERAGREIAVFSHHGRGFGPMRVRR